MDRFEGMRTRSTPIPVPRSTRRVDVRCLTSIPTGKVVPIWAQPLLREDQMMTTQLRVNFEMHETVEILMNAINVNLKAYLVPNLAFDRFDGMDELNRSYMKEKYPSGTGTVTPFFESMVFNRATNPIMTYLGKHAREGQTVNSCYVEAYNEIWNFRATNRSPDIAKRTKLQLDLAKAFWEHQRFAAIVPDFDQALIDGEVPLNVVDSSINIQGIGFTNATNPPATVTLYADGIPATPHAGYNIISGQETPAAGQARLGIHASAVNTSRAAIYAELAENGITVSLSNIELARKTQAFAALRKQYSGFTDEWIIDMLMSGLTLPEQSWRQPMLLASESTIFGMAKRYSSSADDLTASVVNGATFIDLRFRTPKVPVGGIVMVTCEISPEQLWERQMDPYLFTLDQVELPEFLRDTLDPEKVEVVQNQFVDIDHDTPTATFGYAPLNYKWAMNGPNIGGRFYRPTVDAAFDEDRQRIWAVETQNPTLSEDFYLCTNMHNKPFVVTDEDPFDAVTRGVCTIVGNTVFGRPLIEASDDYEKIMAKAPTDRIDKPVAADADELSGDVNTA